MHTYMHGRTHTQTHKHKTCTHVDREETHSHTHTPLHTRQRRVQPEIGFWLRSRGRTTPPTTGRDETMSHRGEGGGAALADKPKRSPAAHTRAECVTKRTKPPKKTGDRRQCASAELPPCHPRPPPHPHPTKHFPRLLRGALADKPQSDAQHEQWTPHTHTRSNTNTPKRIRTPVFVHTFFSEAQRQHNTCSNNPGRATNASPTKTAREKNKQEAKIDCAPVGAATKQMPLNAVTHRRRRLPSCNRV